MSNTTFDAMIFIILCNTALFTSYPYQYDVNLSHTSFNLDHEIIPHYQLLFLILSSTNHMYIDGTRTFKEFELPLATEASKVRTYVFKLVRTYSK